jgi:phage terminase large subunit-like protein
VSARDPLLARFLRLPPHRRAAALAALGQEEADALDSAWRAWAHRGQHPPDPDACADDGSPWRTWVIMAGRGFGKTRAGSEWVLDAVKRTVRRGAGRGVRPVGDYAASPLRIALVAATLDEARRIMVEGESGLLAVADRWISRWEPTKRVLTFAGGAEAHLFSGASPEQLRGPQHHLAWCDELAKWEKPGDTWDMLQLGLRLGTRPRTLVTTTPRPGPVLSRIMAAKGTIVTGGPTHANPHLPGAYVEAVTDLYAGTRLGRQELGGELLPDVPGALWTIELLERCRLNPSPCRGEGQVREANQGEGTRCPNMPSPSHSLRERAPPSPLEGEGEGEGSTRRESPTFTRIAIGVDPPSGDGTCGIIVCARDAAGRAHVLADHSVTNRTPESWARAVASAAQIHARTPLPLREREGPAADRRWEGEGTLPVRIVAEANQGGKMVEAVLRAADANLRIRLVHAADGKSARADPVATLFEAGKIILHGRFPELEAQLCGMIGGGGYEGPGPSPDRADAMVWALWELMIEKQRPMPRARFL